MAAAAKKPKTVKLDYAIPKEIYDDFIRLCHKKGLAAPSIIRRLMEKYNQTDGQI